MKRWSFERKIVVGFGVTTVLTTVIALVSMFALRHVITVKDDTAIRFGQTLIQVQRLNYLIEKNVAYSQSFLLTSDSQILDEMNDVRAGTLRLVDAMLTAVKPGSQDEAYLNSVLRMEAAHNSALIKFIANRNNGRSYGSDVNPARVQLDRTIDTYQEFKVNQLVEASEVSNQAASRMMAFLDTIVIASLGIILILGFLGRRVIREHGTMETTLRESEARYRSLYEKAERAVRARDEVLAVVSHDLKNPLGAVILNAHLLPRISPQGEVGDRIRKQAEKIRMAAERMERLIRDILEVTLIEAGQFKIVSRTCQVNSILSEVVEMMSSHAEQKGVALSIDRKGDEAGNAVFVCDRERILQVFSNLVGNAIKFTPQGGKVQIRAFFRDGALSFVVRDTGPGIPSSSLPHIFDRFWRADPLLKKGSGLGLAIAKGIIDVHGGKIWAESRPGAGTSFYFTLRSSTMLRGIKTVAEALRQEDFPMTKEDIAYSVGDVEVPDSRGRHIPVRVILDEISQEEFRTPEEAVLALRQSVDRAADKAA